MMTGHAQICKDSIERRLIIIAQPTAQIAKVAANEVKTSVVFRNVAFRISVLVKAIKAARRPQSQQNLTTVTATTKSHICINAIGTYIQTIHTFGKQYRYMIS